MTSQALRAVLILGALVAALPARADDPVDPAMRTSSARARDKAVIRQLNLAEAARVRDRDARYAAEARASREATADYADRRARYERDMAAWRRAVAACRSGDHAACAR